MYRESLNPLPKTINIKGALFQFDKPKIMGIINLSPDSFYENDAKKKERDLIKKVSSFIENGADIIDLGGSTTKPNAELPALEDELKRVVGPLKQIRAAFPKLIISVDTVRHEVAEKCLEIGADIINDVSGGFHSQQMWKTVEKYKCPYILTHNIDGGINKSVMSESKNTIVELIRFFSKKITELQEKGIYDIIIDPGFGFSKSLNQNYEIVKNFNLLHILNVPILVGVSRKSMIFKALESDANAALNGTTAMHAMLISKNASIFRVHDVHEMNEVKKLWELSFC
ncbi:MAG: dihydropteroate synthase [Crocinitomicaceae bacterium]|nr:dihydropteroate synthase [Crocinitomicaceae bacterium]